MREKNLWILIAILFLAFGSSASAVSFSDNFNLAHNYLTEGVVDVGWDGFVTGPILESLTTTEPNAGHLYMKSGGNMWAGDNLGALLYKEVSGAFTAQVEITNFPGLWPRSDANVVWYNYGGLMARVPNYADAGAGEDWIMTGYFPIFSNGNRTDLNGWYNTNYQIYAGITMTGWAGGRFLKLEYDGAGNFYQRWSVDGITWQPLNTADQPTVDGHQVTVTPTNRPDMASVAVLQVGLANATWSTSIGWVEWDDFSLTADAFPPHPEARSPVPFDGAIEVNYIGTTLRWKSGDSIQAVNGHELYFSANFADVDGRNPAAKHVLSTNSYSPGQMNLDTTYYWRVDEVNGANKWSAPVWSFTTVAPKATNPNPEDQRGGIDPSIANLSWTPGGPLVVKQDLYFSLNYNDVLNNAPAALVVSNLNADVGTYPTPGVPLDKGKAYYWKVNSNCGVLGMVNGDVWQFKTAFPVEICDDFETVHDYLISGTTGTIWDGIIGKDTITVLATDFNSGKLYMESGNNFWQGDSQGAFLYKEIVGPFIAQVEVTDYPALWDPAHTNIVWHNWGGIMARVSKLEDAGAGEDWITISYFPIWGNGNRGDLNGWYSTNYQIYFGITYTAWDAGRFLQMEYNGLGTFFLRWSTDGVVWQNLNTAPTEQPIVDGHQITSYPTIREDMAGLPLQLGLCQATFNSTLGYIEYENFCFGRDLIAKAYSPRPIDGSGLDLMRPVLSWAPGDFAVTHNVYFGSDFNDVNNATPASPQYRGPANVQGPDASGRFSYNAGQYEILTIGNTYYWRVDEVNATHPDSPWKGNTWAFTVLDYTIIDDFEKYVSTGFPSAPGTLRKTWIDGYWSLTKIVPTPPAGQPQYKITSSASFVQLNTDPAVGGYPAASPRYFNNSNIALLGNQSMKFYYQNDGFYQWLIWLYNYDAVATKYTAPKFSEVVAAIDDAARITPASHESLGLKRNWTGYKLLKVPFYGDPNNTLVATDKLYVGLWDGDNNPTTPVLMVHSNNVRLQKNWWQDWYIPLSAFPAANANFSLSNVARIYIGVGDRTTPATGGTGNIFFDEIQILAYGVCVPGGLAGDFTGDCYVDANDLEAFRNVWLGELPTMPTPLINLDASGLALGPVSSWTNTGSASGVFDQFNPADANLNPVCQMVEGKKAVTFDGSDLLLWKDAIGGNTKMAPATLTSDHAEPNDFTIIAEVWNPSIAAIEPYLSWANVLVAAGGASFGYGSDDYSGAAAHWAPDMGFGTASGVFKTPAAHVWHKIAVTYDGAVETVVVDGVIREIAAKDLQILPANPVVAGCRYYWVSPTIYPMEYFSGSVASIKVYGQAVPPEDLAVLMGSPVDLKQNNLINFSDFAVFALNWLNDNMLGI